VAIHNTAYSFYPEKYAKKAKVFSLEKIIRHFKGKAINFQPIEEKFKNQKLPKESIVIVLVDDMDTRAEIWQKRIKNNPDVFLYFEGRMSFETYRLYTIRPCVPEDIGFYESRLYPQSEAYQETCGQKSIVFTPMSLAAEIACNIKKFVKNEPVYKEIIREFYAGTLIANELMENAFKFAPRL